MGKRKGGYRRKKRNLFRKSAGTKGKISLTRYFQEYTEGEKVTLSLEPAVQTGMYHPRFYGRAGIVEEKRGECYRVKIVDGNKEKSVIVHPIHLRKA